MSVDGGGGCSTILVPEYIPKSNRVERTKNMHGKNKREHGFGRLDASTKSYASNSDLHASLASYLRCCATWSTWAWHIR